MSDAPPPVKSPEPDYQGQPEMNSSEVPLSKHDHRLALEAWQKRIADDKAATELATRKAKRKKTLVRSIVGALVTAIGGPVAGWQGKDAIKEAAVQVISPFVARLETVEKRGDEDRRHVAHVERTGTRTETIVELISKKLGLERQLPPRHREEPDGGEP